MELSAIRLDTKANINVASGQLCQFTSEEPKEPFELEAGFEGNAKTILLHTRLQERQEIEQLLENAVDPFAEVPEDDPAATETLISNFLNDIRNLDVLQKH